MLEFEEFIDHQDPIVRKASMELVGKVAPEKLIEPALNSTTLAELEEVLTAIESVAYNKVEDLTPLLREDDTLRVERVFQAFVAVGRADLLFGLAVSGDERTTQRVKRYLHEQGFIK